MQTKLRVKYFVLANRDVNYLVTYPNEAALKLIISALLNNNPDNINLIKDSAFRVIGGTKEYDPELLNEGAMGPRPTIEIYNEIGLLLDHNGQKEETI